MSNATHFFATTLRSSFQIAATFVGQINGDNAPLYGQAAGHVFDYAVARLA